jgi:hypothetical protein
VETENKKQFKYERHYSLREIGRFSSLRLLRLKNFIAIKTLDKTWGERMGIAGIFAHSVTVADELEGTEYDI